jgi:XTP/dITP diphosphohydrolase
MKQVVLASFNQHKIHEFRLIDPQLPLVTPDIYSINADQSFDEIGTTFFENAYGKARHMAQLIFNKTGIWIPVLADDSGICVDGLGGAPGIYSARFGFDLPQPPKTDQERVQYLLKCLENQDNRKAHYVCNLVCYYGPDTFLCSQEIWEGIVSTSISQGTTGFGYDPIMIIPPGNRCVAEITEEEKARISHRAKAYNMIKSGIYTILKS